jgi:tight adherence protein B
MNDLTIIAGLMFVAATLAVYGFYWFFIFNRRDRHVINRRLELARQLRNTSAVLATLRDERGIKHFKNPILRALSEWFTQTGTQMSLKSLAIMTSAAWLFFTFVLASVMNLVVAAALAVGATAILCALYFSGLRNRRISAFADQLPDAIDIIVRGVRVGLSFVAAVNLIAREMPDPVGTEFGMLADEIGFGLDIRSALDNLYKRVGQPDLLFLKVSVSIQSQTGGNLGEILSRLSRLMRSRATMRLKIKAMSAEGRASALTLSAFPFVLFLIVNLISPTYYGAIRSSPIVEPAIYFGLCMLAVGNLIMYRIVNFKY